MHSRRCAIIAVVESSATVPKMNTEYFCVVPTVRSRKVFREFEIAHPDFRRLRKGRGKVAGSVVFWLPVEIHRGLLTKSKDRLRPS